MGSIHKCPASAARIPVSDIRTFSPSDRQFAELRVAIGTQHAELVSFGVGENDPRRLALPNVYSVGAQRDKSRDLSVAIIGPEIQV